MMRLWIPVALSLVLHLMISTGIYVWKPTVDPLRTRLPVEVTYNTSPKSGLPKDLSKPYIAKLDVPEKLKFEDNQIADFASQERVRVLQETQARNSGLTKNRSSGPKFLQPFQDDLIQQEAARQKSNFQTFTDGVEVFDAKKEINLLNSGPSTISQSLPDKVALGSMTILNTDRHLFYSFYSRMETRSYSRWSDIVRKAIDSIPLDVQRKKLKGRKLTTQLVILLKPNGEFHRAEIHSGSGVQKLDISPALAFQEARIFPNPPAEMVRPDGFIHISASFTVDFRPVQ